MESIGRAGQGRAGHASTACHTLIFWCVIRSPSPRSGTTRRDRLLTVVVTVALTESSVGGAESEPFSRKVRSEWALWSSSPLALCPLGLAAPAGLGRLAPCFQQ